MKNVLEAVAAANTISETEITAVVKDMETVEPSFAIILTVVEGHAKRLSVPVLAIWMILDRHANRPLGV